MPQLLAWVWRVLLTLGPGRNGGLLLEDGNSYLLLENGDFFLLE